MKILLNLIITNIKKITNEVVNRTALAKYCININAVRNNAVRKLIIQGLEKIVG